MSYTSIRSIRALSDLLQAEKKSKQNKVPIAAHSGDPLMRSS